MTNRLTKNEKLLKVAIDDLAERGFDPSEEFAVIDDESRVFSYSKFLNDAQQSDGEMFYISGRASRDGKGLWRINYLIDFKKEEVIQFQSLPLFKTCGYPECEGHH